MKLLPGRLHITALLLASSVVLSGCGGGGGGSSTDKAEPPATSAAPGGQQPSPNPSSVLPTMPKAPTTAPAKVISAFARCLRQHGFNVPDDLQKWTPPPGTDTTKAQAAVAACFQYMTAHPTP